MLTRKDLEKRILDLYMLISDKIKIDGIYLFGSYAKGNPHKDSDIDIAVLSQAFEGIRFIDSSKISRIIINETYVDFEIHTYKTEEFTEDDPFVAEILKTGIKII
ncbi:nucleotidyltransferase domain-containing protein [Melioribacteraceae bacterium 4301-Me]|uniref:nucleotidyltransferase domain-containing protein n=1 Tax=Pyranulibacter aquaticus TaxID=3163344 RepID=UPI0035977DCE